MIDDDEKLLMSVPGDEIDVLIFYHHVVQVVVGVDTRLQDVVLQVEQVVVIPQMVGAYHLELEVVGVAGTIHQGAVLLVEQVEVVVNPRMVEQLVPSEMRDLDTVSMTTSQLLTGTSTLYHQQSSWTMTNVQD